MSPRGSGMRHKVDSLYGHLRNSDVRGSGMFAVVSLAVMEYAVVVCAVSALAVVSHNRIKKLFV